jgi:rhodanese-related sulfurtransferase
MRTSDQNIYAVGDAVEVRDFVTGFPTLTALAGPANKQARIAADNALGRKSIFTGTLGTSVVKVFDMTLACTGTNEKFLKKHNIPYLVSYTHSGSHAGYYPGATNTSIKIVFSPGTGKVLGAQIVGKIGVDKRSDVLATAIRAKMTVFDLQELELAYAPPYSSAKDPINICGFVAANILKGDMEIAHWSELEALQKNGEVLIDLRTKFELKHMGKIEGALHIPIDELRSRLSELDKQKTYIPFCSIGFRGYLGHRILVQNGFNSKNLSGGFMTYTIGNKKK